MLLADMLGWWYSRGWAWISRQFFSVYTTRILQFFSITELLKTLFAPFRQDVIETKGAPVGVKLQVLGGNIISRFFGFLIRMALICAGLTTLIFSFLAGGAAIIAWPLLPIAILVMPVVARMIL